MITERRGSLPLTAVGRGRLQDELERLRLEHEPACRERLRDLRVSASLDDLELQLALDELARVQQRVRELEQLLAAAPADGSPHPPGTITIGSQVMARDDSGLEHVFVLVSPLEAGAVRGHVSTASPVGAALLGRRALGLTPGQLTAVGTVMALFVEDDLARGVSPWATKYCPACDDARSLPGLVRYDGTSAGAFVCNVCATEYEIARMRGLVSGIDDFVRGKTAGAAPSHHG